MEEKKNNNTLLKVLIVILLLVICFGLGWFGKDYIKVSENSNESSSNKSQNNSSEKAKEVELDIHSSLIQLLYNEVSYDLEYKSWFFNNSIYPWEFAIDKDFIVSSATEKDKMKIVGGLLTTINHQRVCNNIPERPDVGIIINNCTDYYTREQVENAYHQLYGTGANLDTSIIIEEGISAALTKYAYDANSDGYYRYIKGSGGTTAPGGYIAKLVKAVREDNNIVLYQNVERYDTNKEGDVLEKHSQTFQLVYTFNNEKENEYVFVSKEKKA